MEEDQDGPPARRRAKESRRKTRWSPRLADVIRLIVMGADDEDYVVKETLAHDLKAQVHDVGQALATLCREGILSGPAQHPTTYVECGKGARKAGRELPESVRVGASHVEWDGREWVVTLRGAYLKPGYRDRRTTLTKREIARAEKKSPRTGPSGWDGLAYRIERRSAAYLELVAERGSAPRGGRTCKRCGREFPRQRGRTRTCPDRRSCDTSIVSGVMDT